jgi:hypothetical protein
MRERVVADSISGVRRRTLSRILKRTRLPRTKVSFPNWNLRLKNNILNGQYHECTV